MSFKEVTKGPKVPPTAPKMPSALAPVNNYRAAIQKICSLTTKGKVGPVPRKWDMDAWIAGYDQAFAEIQDIITKAGIDLWDGGIVK